MKKILMSALCVLGLVAGSVQAYEVFEVEKTIFLCKDQEKRGDWLTYKSSSEEQSPDESMQIYVDGEDNKRILRAGSGEFVDGHNKRTRKCYIYHIVEVPTVEQID